MIEKKKKKKRWLIFDLYEFIIHPCLDIANIRFETRFDSTEEEVYGIVSWVKNILGKLCFKI